MTSPSPYAPPAPYAQQAYRASAPHGFGGDMRGHKPWVSWVYLVCLLVSLASLILGFWLVAVSDEMDDARDTVNMLGGMSVLLGLMLYNVKVVLSLVWLHGAWSWLPMEQRVTSSGKVVTPGSAVGFLFIPYYNLYWMFVANVGLCDAMERMRVSFRGVRPAPRGLAMAACICQVIPLANLFVAPFVWFFYMRAIDGFREDAHREMAAAPAY